MPVYRHACTCGEVFEVVKRMADIDRPETCRSCGAENVQRVIAPFNFTGAADWNTQGWNHGLGCYTRNNREARQIAKAKGFEEAGDTKLETLHKDAETKRADRYRERWADDRIKLYD